DGAFLRDSRHEVFGVPAFLLGDGDEVLVHVGHHHARLIAHERNGEERLEARATAGDDRDGAGGRDGGDVAVAEQLHGTDALPFRVARTGLVRTPDAARPLGERPALGGESPRLALALDVDELHHLAAELDALGAVIWY